MFVRILAAALALAAGPAAAQVFNQPDPNSWNAALNQQATVRGLELQRTSDLNALRMQSQRNAQIRPSEGAYGPVLLRRGPAAGAGPHRGALRAGARGGRSGGGLATSVCVGC